MNTKYVDTLGSYQIPDHLLKKTTYWFPNTAYVLPVRCEVTINGRVYHYYVGGPYV